MRNTTRNTAKLEPVTFDMLKEGEVDLGHGVTLSPVLRNGHLLAARFTHEVKGGGTCSSILRLDAKRTWRLSRHYWTTWKLKLGENGELNLSPSCACYDHNIHGWVEDGLWLPLWEWSFRYLTDEQFQYKLDRADEIIEEYGGGLEGARLALAARQLLPRKKIPLEQEELSTV